MERSILISHSHKDEQAAATLAELISRVTLGQLTAWFSSDTSQAGGLRPGELWMTTLMERLRASTSVVALVTPNSLNQPWLYFESGFVAALAGSDIMPVCIGLPTMTEVPFPLAMYHTYQLNDVRAVSVFVEKLVGRYGIRFDREMTRPVVEWAVARLATLSFDRAAAAASAGPPAWEGVRDYFDRRFLELADMVGTMEAQGGRRTSKLEYGIRFDLRFPDLVRSESLTIDPATTTVQDILDNLFFILTPRVDPYSYLASWIVLRADPGASGDLARTGIPLIVNGLSKNVLARELFRPGSAWLAVPLQRPYEAGQPLAIPEGRDGIEGTTFEP